MKALALLINDIHVSKDCIGDFVTNWSEMIAVAEQYGVDKVIIGGDLFTSRSSQTLSVLLAVRNALKVAVTNGIRVIIAPGNHDKVNQNLSESYPHVFADMSGVCVIDDYYCLNLFEQTDEVLYVFPYYPESNGFVDLFLSVVQNCGPKENVSIYIHEGVHGALGDFEIPNELPQDIFQGFRQVLVGHYHNRTKIKGTNIEYIGASRQHNYGEDEEKGYTIFFEDGSTKFVKNCANVRYATITVRADITDDEMDGLLEEYRNREVEYRIKVKIKCSDSEAKTFDKKRFLDKGVNKVEIVMKKLEQLDVVSENINKKFDRHGIKAEYVNYCDMVNVDSSLGLSYMEG